MIRDPAAENISECVFEDAGTSRHETASATLPERQGQNLALTVLFVQNSLDSEGQNLVLNVLYAPNLLDSVTPPDPLLGWSVLQNDVQHAGTILAAGFLQRLMYNLYVSGTTSRMWRSASATSVSRTRCV